MDKRTVSNLKGLHPLLVKLITEADKNSPIPFSVTDGIRTAEEQHKAFEAGRSKLDGYKKIGKHQKQKDGYGHAFDAHPMPYNPEDLKKYKSLAAHIKQTAKKLGIKIAWGGDWKTFIDRPHYELA